MKKLQNRLVLGFLAVICIVLCSVSVSLLVILRQNPLEERATYLELDILSRSVVALVRRQIGTNAIRIEPGAHGFALLEELAERQDMRIAWANAQKRLLFDSEHRWDTKPPADIFARLHRTNNTWRGQSWENGRRWLIVAQPIAVDGETQGYIIAARPAPVFQFLKQFRNTLLQPLVQAGLIALVPGILLALLISRSIARPLRQVSETAKALAGGNLDARAPIAGPEEVRQLAETFNDMAQNVQASQQTQRDLVANVAHDLRTPLTSIHGFAQALVDGTAATPDVQRRAATAIHEEARRMHRMTNALLDLARFEAGEIALRHERIDLVTLARTRVEHFAVQAHDAGIALGVTATEPVIITGDAGRLEQVLDNLLSNALTHTAPGGRITIHVHAAPPSAELAVADTGTGIPPEDLPRIFERFYRGDKARQGTGTGLGLAIVREIVRAHGGDVRAESVIGVGSKFTVRLPLEAEA